MTKKPPRGQTFSMSTHVTLLQPNATTSDEDLALVFKTAHELQKYIPCLIAVSTGENQSNRHRGFTHGIILHFEDETHLREAMTHPTYVKLYEKVQRVCEQIVTFDLQETIPLPDSGPAATPNEAEPPIPKPRGRRKQPASYIPKPTSERSVRIEDLMPKYGGRPLDQRLVKIIVNQLGVDESEVTPSTSFVEDLDADSLDLVELIMEVEAAFKVTVSDEVAEQLTTAEECGDMVTRPNC